MRVDYPTLRKTVAALTEGETDSVALTAKQAGQCSRCVNRKLDFIE